MTKLPAEMVPAPPYAATRFTFGAVNESIDVAPIQHLPCWQAAFPTGQVDWDNGWKQLWVAAGDLCGTGTDYRAGRVAIEVEAYFQNGELASKAVAILGDEDIDDDWEPRAISLLVDVCGADDPIAGCVGLVVDEVASPSRPTLTLMVSGPGGGLDAAMIVRQSLADMGLNAGIAFRTSSQGAAGVVKIPFLPELYLQAGHNSFSIDWKMWSAIAQRNPPREWSTAALFWCDAVIAGVERLRDTVPMMIDDVFFDFMRVVPLGDTVSAKSLILSGSSLAELMKAVPHEFMFRTSL